MGVTPETTYKFLDGLEVPREGWATRGLLMEQRPDLMPKHIEPLIQNELWSIRQDAEFPVPGFYVLGARPQILSFADLPPEEAAIFATVLRVLRATMRQELGIERVNIYLEEKLREPHLHVWVVPLWPAVMDRCLIEPRIWEGNIRHYLELFRFEDEGAKILDFNSRMREALLQNPEIRALGFA